METTQILLSFAILLLIVILTQTYKLNYIQKVSKRTDVFMTEMFRLINEGREGDERLRIPDPTPNPTPDILPK